jgi:hypothetical protein
MIVHGVTMQVGFGGEEPKPYRIGIPHGDLDYMNKFLRHAANVEHSFTVERVRQVTAECKALASKLGPITTNLIKLLVASQPIG